METSANAQVTFTTSEANAWHTRITDQTGAVVDLTNDQNSALTNRLNGEHTTYQTGVGLGINPVSVNESDPTLVTSSANTNDSTNSETPTATAASESNLTSAGEQTDPPSVETPFELEAISPQTPEAESHGDAFDQLSDTEHPSALTEPETYGNWHTETEGTRSLTHLPEFLALEPNPLDEATDKTEGVPGKVKEVNAPENASQETAQENGEVSEGNESAKAAVVVIVVLDETATTQEEINSLSQEIKQRRENLPGIKAKERQQWDAEYEKWFNAEAEKKYSHMSPEDARIAFGEYLKLMGQMRELADRNPFRDGSIPGLPPHSFRRERLFEPPQNPAKFAPGPKIDNSESQAESWTIDRLQNRIDDKRLDLKYVGLTPAQRKLQTIIDNGYDGGPQAAWTEAGVLKEYLRQYKGDQDAIDALYLVIGHLGYRLKQGDPNSHDWFVDDEKKIIYISDDKLWGFGTMTNAMAAKQLYDALSTHFYNVTKLPEIWDSYLSRKAEGGATMLAGVGEMGFAYFYMSASGGTGAILGGDGRDASRRGDKD